MPLRNGQATGSKINPGSTPGDLGFRLFVVAALMVYAALAFFARPYADDYTHAVQIQEVGVGRGIAQQYLEWMGRYTTIVLFQSWSWLMNLTDFGLYWTLPLLVMLGYLLSLRKLLRTLSTAAGVRADPGWLAAPILVLCLVRFGRHLYWAAGAVAYWVPNVLLLLLVSLLLQATLSAAGKPSRWRAPGAGMLAFLVAGGNEGVLFALLVILLTGSAICYRRHLPGRRLWLVCLLCATAGALLLLLSPGNQQRLAAMAANTEGQSGFCWNPRSLAQLACFFADRLQRWSCNSGLLGLAFLFTPFLFRLVRGVRRPDRWFPAATIALLASWLAILGGWLFLPFLLGLPYPPKRLEAAVYLVFVAGFLGGVFSVGLGLAKSGRTTLALPPCWTRSAPAVFALGIFLSWGSSGLINACGDLLFRAAPFARAFQAREALLRRADDDGESRVTVEPLLTARKPRVLPWEEISGDSRYFYDQSLARYHGLETVVLEAAPQ